jgi:hypothetical protein
VSGPHSRWQYWSWDIFYLLQQSNPEPPSLRARTPTQWAILRELSVTCRPIAIGNTQQPLSDFWLLQLAAAVTFCYDMESKAITDLLSPVNVLNLIHSLSPNEAAFKLVFRLCQLLCWKEIHFATRRSFAICAVHILTTVTFLNTINLLGFIMAIPCVFCEVRTKVLIKMRVNSC